MSTQKRDEQNALLRKHGYRWQKITQDWLDDMDDYVTRPGWHLYAPDGRDVSVSQALDEINRGAGVVLAEKAEQQRAAEERARRVAEIKAEIAEARQLIIEQGDMPKLDSLPVGERVLDTSNIMGSGDTFIITNEHIYYLEFNGMDGDDWSRSNVGGAIGWRIEYDWASAGRLREMRDELVELGAHTRLSMFGGTMPAEQ